MRRIAVTEFVSLDGVMEAPGGEDGFRHGAWTFDYADDEGYAYKFAEVMEHDTLLLGRVQYEGFAAAWPQRSGDFADRMNAMEKVVVSTTLTDPAWNNTRVISENVAEQVAALKEEPGQDILVAGSSSLVQFLTANDLVDVYRLMVFPVVLGGGKRVFGDDGARVNLKLESRRVLDTGTLILHYARLDD
jgi:dihydrofolate reductase